MSSPLMAATFVVTEVKMGTLPVDQPSLHVTAEQRGVGMKLTWWCSPDVDQVPQVGQLINVRAYLKEDTP